MESLSVEQQIKLNQIKERISEALQLAKNGNFDAAKQLMPDISGVDLPTETLRYLEGEINSANERLGNLENKETLTTGNTTRKYFDDLAKKEVEEKKNKNNTTPIFTKEEALAINNLFNSEIVKDNIKSQENFLNGKTERTKESIEAQQSQAEETLKHTEKDMPQVSNSLNKMDKRDLRTLSNITDNMSYDQITNTVKGGINKVGKGIKSLFEKYGKENVEIAIKAKKLKDSHETNKQIVHKKSVTNEIKNLQGLTPKEMLKKIRQDKEKNKAVKSVEKQAKIGIGIKSLFKKNENIIKNAIKNVISSIKAINLKDFQIINKQIANKKSVTDEIKSLQGDDLTPKQRLEIIKKSKEKTSNSVNQPVKLSKKTLKMIKSFSLKTPIQFKKVYSSSYSPEVGVNNKKASAISK